MNYQARLDKIRSKMGRQRLDGLLISNPHNRRYLSGFRGGDHGIEESSGLLLIPRRGDVQLLTDGRFLLQARQELDSGIVHSCPKGHLATLADCIKTTGVKRLGFESQYTLHSSAIRMSKVLTDTELVPLSNFVEPMRLIKDVNEIGLIREAVRLNESIFQRAFAALHTHKSEIDLALTIESNMRKQGAEGPSFDTIVASGENGASPHAIPSTSLLAPPSTTIDMGLIYKGYCSDMTRNFSISEPSEQYLKLHRLVRSAQRKGIEAIRAGVKCCDVDRAARKVISDAGYGKYFCHSLGHGVGLAVHEGPRLSSKSRQKLQPGMIVTVEPGIYIPNWGGIRLEDMVVVTEDGCENLNQDTTWLDI